MFTDTGTPVRATLTVTFREFEEVSVDVGQGFFVAPPTLRQVIEGDALAFIAGEMLGNPAAWRAIAEANGLDDPFELPPGLTLVVPPAVGSTASGGPSSATAGA
jgi:nucleoid-associated protein YgaU